LKRIQVIDYMRGFVMIIMALDHVRDLMHTTSLTNDPTDLNTTTAGLFLTRWITHLCAPTFVFLSGTSAYLAFQQSQKNISETRAFLLSRGLWLILLEFTVVNFALWFDIQFRLLIMEVICAIGFGMIVLSFLLKLSPRSISVIGILIIAGHNLLDGLSFQDNPTLNFLFSLFFRTNFFPVSQNFSFLVGYPLIPWLGILLVGFYCGTLFERPVEERKKLFLKIGGAALILFCIVRFLNIYGNPTPWITQKTFLFTFLSFINITKYPPSLIFVLATLGVTFLILSILDGVENRMTRVLSVYGKVPLFYFIIHLYMIHLMMFAMVFAQGFGIDDLQFGALKFGRPQEGTGVDLPLIYLIWFVVVLLLYPLCKWYGNYKYVNRENKFLRYL
jgi:uncharacterized membrane protein